MIDYLSNRQSVLGLLLIPCSALSLHIYRLPFWLSILAAVIFIWRFLIYQGRLSAPNKLARLCLVVIALAIVVVYYQQWYSLEPMVTLLIIAFLLKILEVTERRDAIVLVFVGYFVTASAFLFNQGIVITLGGIVVLCLLTACLLDIHSLITPLFSRRTLRRVSIMLLQAVPLMLLFIFIFPRIGTLWSVPLQSSSAYTGVSDTMSPGDLSQLTRSDKIAFRVTFENDAVPSPSSLYWRGLVFSQFDGREWSRRVSESSRLLSPVENLVELDKVLARYEVILEPTAKPWIYGIPFASISGVNKTLTHELILDEPVLSRKRYEVVSYQGTQTQERQAVMRNALLLPQGFNPKALEQARRWRKLSKDAEDYIDRVLTFYNQSFHYTLSPPKVGLHSVDEFLFSSQAGFCEHFSSSFVVLMRAVGIPARVVVGYQGGEWNPADNYMIIRQRDAHAWAEVWLPGKGWLRVDPTAAVAPERIELGLSDSLSTSDQELLDGSTLATFEWLTRMMLQWDSLNYRWQRWVVQFDEEQQSTMLKDLLGEVTPFRLALALFVPAGILFLSILWSMINVDRKRKSVYEKLYTELRKRLNRYGVESQEGDALTDLCDRAAEALPEKQGQLLLIREQFNLFFYGQTSTKTKRQYKRLNKLLKAL